jgi:AraC-like DNA-binding protein
MDGNICKFVPVREGTDVRVLNFVYEKNPEVLAMHRVQSHAGLYLVVQGEGVLHINGGHSPLRSGAMFLTFPLQQYYIEQSNALEYMYITFVGQRMLSIAERVGLTEQSNMRLATEELLPFWKSALHNSTPGNIDLVAESVLMYSLAQLTPDMPAGPQNDITKHKNISVARRIREYADAHYCDTSLTLSSLAEQMSYNPKYLSDCFSREFGLGFREYVQSLRIQRACELMQNGVTSSKEIAYLIGFNDPLYFSKVFARVMGKSPQRFIADLKKQNA